MESSTTRAPGNAAAGTPATEVHRDSDGRLNRRLQFAINQIEESLRGLRFGQVTITVQDGVVVQIDRLERTRVQRIAE